MGQLELLIVTGWAPRGRVRNDPGRRLSKLIADLLVELRWNPAVILQGGADGVDRAAEKYALAGGVPFITMPALWEAEGRSAGTRRNTRMLGLAQLHAQAGWRVRCLAIPGPKSVGTYHMLRQCQDVGWECHVHKDHGGP